MVKDINVGLPLYKFVDDSTPYEICKKKTTSSKINEAADKLVGWCDRNRMKINPKKTQEMIINFSRTDPTVERIIINGTQIEQVPDAKLLGVYISDDLTWEVHVNYITSKANKKLYAIRLLKRANIPMDKILRIYCASIRPVVEYACPVWHGGLTKDQSKKIEKIQERALRIIMPEADYELALQIAEMSTLEDRRIDICRKLFHDMQDSSHRLHHLLPYVKGSELSSRAGVKYPLPKVHTDRTKHNSFINYCLFNLQ